MQNSEILFAEYDNLINSLVGKGADYDDAATLALQAIERAIPFYDAERPALPYLATIAKNLGTDAWRHNPDRETRQSFGKNPDGSIRYQRPYFRMTTPGGLRIFGVRTTEKQSSLGESHHWYRGV